MKPFDLSIWPYFQKNLQETGESALVDQIVIDSRRIHSSHALFVALPGKIHDGHQFVHHADQLGARFAIVSNKWVPQSPLKQIKLISVEQPLEALQQITHYYRLQRPAKVIAITGTQGKTMVKDLLHSMLSTTFHTTASPGSFNSQIGVPLSLLTTDETHQYSLIEAGISSEGEMDKLASLITPDYAILTNVGKTHIPYFSSLETVVKEKIKLPLAVPKQGWALLPDHPLINEHLLNIKCAYHLWNRDNSELPRVRSLALQPTSEMPYEITFPNSTDFQGKITNGFTYLLDVIKICVKAAWLLGVEEKKIIEVLKSYEPEPMQAEIWRSPLGPIFINDSYCSDPLSIDLSLPMLQLGSTHGRRILIFSGIRDTSSRNAGYYRRVGKAIRQAKLAELHLCGDEEFGPLSQELSSETAQYKWKNVQLALLELRNQFKPQDIVLIKGARKEPLDGLIKAVNDSPSDNKYLINLSAINTNIDTLRSRLPSNCRLMIMVKASAYGTDAIIITKFLELCGINIFGLSYADEAIALRRAGVTQDLFVLNASLNEATKIVKWDLEVGVSDSAMIDALAHANHINGSKSPIKVHLHVDTGMSRFGCRPHEALGLARKIIQTPSLKLHGLMTHLACAESEEGQTFTQAQLKKFDGVINSLRNENIYPPWIHAANSAGVINFDLPQYNLTRVGLCIYGLQASESCAKKCDLRPAVTLTSHIVGINQCKKGETVSYGRTYKVQEKNERIAILPIGYFDGLHRHYSGKGHVIIRGQKAPMVGTICMDYMMVNVTHIPNVSVGDTALLFGEDEYGYRLNPETLASQGNSVLHELITCLGPRLPRVFLYQY